MFFQIHTQTVVLALTALLMGYTAAAIASHNLTNLASDGITITDTTTSKNKNKNDTPGWIINENESRILTFNFSGGDDDDEPRDQQWRIDIENGISPKVWTCNLHVQNIPLTRDWIWEAEEVWNGVGGHWKHLEEDWVISCDRL
ncbi:uncharacterized protein I303_106169 [Kwoniella dejecticola CBS 10117]|uniref:Uncharacterized protein n=1 Tax=Kwoniella dejecticola CBS 10117 TaxID=1296121 RepID=A0A1A6A1G7_9TREE|nr:uncharacterized protein I303_06187 [Kwoniella dejecticola CBS 10117]OBR83902.1 hypothetical protein I303_06187 [Kwoniella dejecticola CBS 10117]